MRGPMKTLTPQINRNILTLKESSTLAINQQVKDLRRQGKDVVHFGFGQSPFPVPPALEKALKEQAGNKEYLPTLGLPELRQAFCGHFQKLYGVEFDPAQVVIGPGSKELLFQAMLALEGPLLIPTASWVSYGPQAHICGKPVVVIPTQREQGYKLTPQELKKTCQSLANADQKLLILNSPNNPSGSMYHQSEIDALIPVCRKYGVLILADEIYSLTAFGGQVAPSFAKAYPEGTLVTTGLSKGFSAGGYRLGVMAFSKSLAPVMDAMKALASETFSCVSSPAQYAALAAYSNDPEVEAYVKNCTRVHGAAGLYLHERFLAMGLQCPRPEGAFYLCPDFEKQKPQLNAIGITTSEQLCHHLLNEHAVAALPGSDFYFPPSYLSVRVASVDYDGAQVLQAAQQASALDRNFVEQFCPSLKNGCDRIENFVQSL